jgi:CysZ protein
MNAFFQGIAYNFKGLRLGLRTPRLLMLGLLRFALLVIVTVAVAALVLLKYQDILNLMWTQPVSPWIVWLWHLVSWLLALVLLGVSAVLGFLVSQILFSVFIMDLMSQVTERTMTGNIQVPSLKPWYRQFFHLLRQELPRAVVPVLLAKMLLIFGWFTPLGPFLTLAASLAAGIFLAWDNTDLVQARRMIPFYDRLAFLRRHLAFHLGFGILFLIPGLNILLLSFAPVGGTLFQVEKIDSQKRPTEMR